MNPIPDAGKVVAADCPLCDRLPADPVAELHTAIEKLGSDVADLDQRVHALVSALHHLARGLRTNFEPTEDDA